MTNRFDYVKYDQSAADKQARFKKNFEEIEQVVRDHLIEGRAKALVYTKLEEAYMWIGKAIRDEQTAKRHAELQEERTNGLASR